MAWALVTHLAVADTGFGGYTSGPFDDTGGTLLTVFVSDYSGGSRSVITDNKGNVWLTATGQVGGDSGGQWWYVVNPTVGAGHTVTITGGTCVGSIFISAWSGIATPALDQQNGAASANAQSLQPGSITPSANGALVLAGLSQAGSAISGLGISGGGFTALLDSVAFSAGTTEGGAVASVIQTTASATNPTYAWTSFVPATVEIVAFNGAAGGITAAQLAGLFDQQLSGQLVGLVEI